MGFLVGRSLRWRVRGAVAASFASIVVAGHAAAADDAASLLGRAADAARALNYVGTIVFHHGPAVETARIVHVNDNGEEFEKLVALDGPAREVVRQKGEVRCYYPDSKVVRVEPRTFRNAFPSLSPQQQESLARYYVVRKSAPGRVAGRDVQGWSFEPKDAYRYAQEFWTDTATGMLLKARTLDERGGVLEQFAFLDLVLGAKIDAALTRPSWPVVPPDWQEKRGRVGGTMPAESGWVVGKPPPGFAKIMEGLRSGRDEKPDVVQLVYSDGLVAVSVFIEPRGQARRASGRARQGGINQFSVRQDDHVVTALGEAPAETVRQIAMSVARR
ncbi:MAG: MucB/RseB C-terminal domain-containing protein [Burkholderiales bacterium]